MPQHDDPASDHGKRGERDDKCRIERLRQNHRVIHIRMHDDGNCCQNKREEAGGHGKDDPPPDPARVMFEDRRHIPRPADTEPLLGKRLFDEVDHLLVLTHSVRR